jgi:NAD(P)-dependent dehydrogenase (short-subunit alcohol dehydrogenase family)
MFEKASSNISASSESENPLYKASKLANVFFAQELAKRLSDEDINIKVYACCPGIVASNITRHMDLPWFSEKVLLPLVYRTIFKTSSQVT